MEGGVRTRFVRTKDPNVLTMRLFSAYEGVRLLALGKVNASERQDLQEKLLCRLCRVSAEFASHTSPLLPVLSHHDEEGSLHFLLLLKHRTYYLCVREKDDSLSVIRVVRN